MADDLLPGLPLKLRGWVPVLVVALLLVLPEALHACPVCFDQKEKNRMAFFVTTIFLSLLPLSIIAAMAWWIRRKAVEASNRQNVESLAGSAYTL